MAADIQVLLASKDLESPQFDPISLINDMLPNEQALSGIFNYVLLFNLFFQPFN